MSSVLGGFPIERKTFLPCLSISQHFSRAYRLASFSFWFLPFSGTLTGKSMQKASLHFQSKGEKTSSRQIGLSSGQSKSLCGFPLSI